MERYKGRGPLREGQPSAARILANSRLSLDRAASMAVEVTTVEGADAPGASAYQAFVEQHPAAMCSHTLDYLRLLQTTLPHARPHYLLAQRKEEVVGVLPAFIATDPELGATIGSLPFFGSHGGPLVTEDGAEDTLRALMDALDQTAKETGAVAASLHLTPMETRERFLRDLWAPQLDDERLGQIKDLPPKPDDILDTFSKPRRGNILRAERERLEFTTEARPEWISWLEKMHRSRMEYIGGRPKPDRFFEACRAAAEASDFCRFTFMLQDGEPVAGLLNLRWRHWEEYMLPVYDPETTQTGASAAIVHEEMKDAVSHGVRRWNFGGTLPDQKGVYRFKSEFGSDDHRYAYLIKIYDDAILDVPPQEVSAAFPYFYVYPYHAYRGDE